MPRKKKPRYEATVVIELTPVPTNPMNPSETVASTPVEYVDIQMPAHDSRIGDIWRIQTVIRVARSQPEYELQPQIAELTDALGDAIRNIDAAGHRAVMLALRLGDAFGKFPEWKGNKNLWQSRAAKRAARVAIWQQHAERIAEELKPKRRTVSVSEVAKLVYREVQLSEDKSIKAARSTIQRALVNTWNPQSM
jgi:hypothetical protein